MTTIKLPILITPVKDSLSTTQKVIMSLRAEHQEIPYYIFDDHSALETRSWLKENQSVYRYQLTELSTITPAQSPNYRTTLIEAQKLALSSKCHLAIVESDVYTTAETILELNRLADQLTGAGLVGALTLDNEGKINFPYQHIPVAGKEKVFVSNKSISFCCTIITHQFLSCYDFNELPKNLDWFDVFLSRKSRHLGMSNYLVQQLQVLHEPHSSRPWKKIKYRNPVRYYLQKLIRRRDRI